MPRSIAGAGPSFGSKPPTGADAGQAADGLTRGRAADGLPWLGVAKLGVKNLVGTA